MTRHVLRGLLNNAQASVCRQKLRKGWPTGRRQAATLDTTNFSKTGEQIHGFTLFKVLPVPELHLTALQLEHNHTGAQYLHVSRQDQNNVFSINFKTNPDDDTGVPHILEHVTLCGSQRYPVRDPFFKMMPRSLANYMNAFTAAEYTSYPFSTTNKQDFRNLSSVYLDSTLRPLLKKSDFLQEGWRLGLEDPRTNMARDTILFKGVVYNEMKGQMSDASYVYYARFRDHMIPALHNSGGDPDKITDLTYERLVDFSRKYYHPSNARFYSYGDLDLSDQLRLVDSELQGFDKSYTDQEIRMPRNLESGPFFMTIPGPMDPMQGRDRQSKSSISWRICHTSDIVESFSFGVASSLLMNGYGSPLYRGLIESGLGTHFSANTGFDSSGRVGIYSIGLDGMRRDEVANLKDTVGQIFREQAQEAFLSHKVEGYMHQLEIALRHKTASFGMSLLEKVLPSWFNGVDPVESLKWNDVVNAFKKRLEQPDYLMSMVAKYLQNDKCLVFTMDPSESFNKDGEDREAKRREKLLSLLEKKTSDPEQTLQVIQKQELDLLHEQESLKDANLETLPSLHVDDISRQKERRPVYSQEIGNSHSLWRETETNGVTYIQGKYELKGMNDELRSLLPLFTDSLMRLGTKDRSVGDLEAEILLKTGGISISPYVSQDPWDPKKCSEGLSLNSYALDKNVNAMLDLLRTLICHIDFGSQAAISAIYELLESKVSGALDSVAEAGHQFATLTASAALSRSDLMQEQISGLSQIQWCARLLHGLRSGPESIQSLIEKLKTIQRSAISDSGQLSFRVVCESAAASNNASLLHAFKRNLPERQTLTTDGAPEVRPQRRSKILFNLPYQVSYAGTCFKTAAYTSPSTASLTILGQLLTHNYMHPKIREQGGAYGASAIASPLSGLFSMSSYRDPNPRNTLRLVSEAGVFARNKEWTTREIEEGKLGVFQQIDAPRSVSGDGSKQFMYGITEDMDQEMRQRLLDVTKSDIQEVADRFLVDVPAERQASCLLGEKKDWMSDDWSIKHLHVAE